MEKYCTVPVYHPVKSQCGEGGGVGGLISVSNHPVPLLTEILWDREFGEILPWKENIQT
jgi:hypothetical protein